MAAFSALGKSQRWIAQELKVSKSWVLSALNRLEKDPSPAPEGTSSAAKGAIRAHHGAAPYGFEVLDGQLVESPRELRTVQKIIELWNLRYGPAAIARELNKSKLRTRKGKSWDHSVVTDVILRAQDQRGPYARFSKALRPYQARKSPKTTQAIDQKVQVPKPKKQYDKGEEKYE